MTTFPCFKCNGSGEVAFRHIANGVCFQCGGTGKISSRQAGVKFEPKHPIIPEADCSTLKQWEYLTKLTGDIDSVARKALYAAGAPCASQIYVSKAIMSRAIEIAKGAA